MALRESQKSLGALLIFIFLTILMTYPLPFVIGNKVRDYGDSLLNTWILTTVAEKLAGFKFKDFFSANIFYPEERPLLYSELLIPQAILAWPIIKMSGQPLLAHNLLLLLALITSALSMFFLSHYLCREFWPSVLAGIIFAFSPFMIGHTFQVQVLSAGGLPLIFLFLHRYFRFGRWIDWLAFILVYIVQSLANIYYAFFLIIFSGLFILLWALVEKTYRKKIFWIHLFIFICLFIIFLGPVFLAYAQHQIKGGLERTIGAEATIRSFLVTPRINWFYGQWSSRFRRPEQELFPGFVAIFLALIAIISASAKCIFPFIIRKGRDFQGETKNSHLSIADLDSSATRLESKDIARAQEVSFSNKNIILFYLLILIVGVLLSFGSKGPFYLFHHFVPGYNAIRAATRFHIFTMLALSVLAAFGLAALLTRIKIKKLRALFVFLILASAILEYLSIPLPLRPVKSRHEMAEVYQELSQFQEKKVILELPLPEPGTGLGRVEGPRMYYSLFHRHHLVNGYSGFFSPTYLKIREKLNQQSLEENLIYWRQLGIDLIIIHCEELGLEDCPSLIDNLKQSPHLLFRGQFGSDFLFSIL